MSQGWISIHRQLQSHWLWDDKPFSKGQAWIDLLMLANHADKKIMLGNELIEVQAGSFITSEYKLMERWGWSKTKVRSFLDMLQKDQMIVKKTDRKKTTIIIEKYGFFQDSETTERPQKNYKKTTERPQKNPNNNENKNNIYSLIVDYLNQKTGQKYKHSTKKTQTCIHARLAEGFTEEDFRTVIDKKCTEWIGTEWEKYLRPETLFGTKFESYLNAKVTKHVNTAIPPGSNQDDLDGLF